jgi:AcrR family transcriptional regulator
MNTVHETIEMEVRNNREIQRDDLRNRLIDAAERQMATGGLAGLKARDVTTEAGCALGALYNAFEDLDRLVLHVNLRTLSRLGDALKTACPTDGSATDTMLALSRAYVTFALENRRLWAALFDHRLPEGVETPDWYLNAHSVLIAQIGRPLASLRPDLSPEDRALRSKTLFAAVHGVVQLALQGRFIGVPADRIAPEVDAIVIAMTRGLGPA